MDMNDNAFCQTMSSMPGTVMYMTGFHSTLLNPNNSCINLFLTNIPLVRELIMHFKAKMKLREIPLTQIDLESFMKSSQTGHTGEVLFGNAVRNYFGSTG